MALQLIKTRILLIHPSSPMNKMLRHWLCFKITHVGNELGGACLYIPFSSSPPLELNHFHWFLIFFPRDSFYGYMNLYIKLGCTPRYHPRATSGSPSAARSHPGFGGWTAARSARHPDSRWWPVGDGPVGALTIASASVVRCTAPQGHRNDPPRRETGSDAVVTSAEVTSAVRLHQTLGPYDCSGPRVMRNLVRARVPWRSGERPPHYWSTLLHTSRIIFPRPTKTCWDNPICRFDTIPIWVKGPVQNLSVNLNIYA